jgi:hypothetical protein
LQSGDNLDPSYRQARYRPGTTAPAPPCLRPTRPDACHHYVARRQGRICIVRPLIALRWVNRSGPRRRFGPRRACPGYAADAPTRLTRPARVRLASPWAITPARTRVTAHDHRPGQTGAARGVLGRAAGVPAATTVPQATDHPRARIWQPARHLRRRRPN